MNSILKSDVAALTTEARIDALLGQMSLAEKIGQVTQVEKNSIQPEDVARNFIGSVLSGGGGNPSPNNAQTWASMVRGFQEAALQTRLGIPLIYGSDGVHGHNNVWGAVIFPHNIGLGATRDADLMERIGQITARELLATNVHWDFAPAVSVPQDIRWGRTYEGYSEDTAIVTDMAVAYTRGLQQLPVRVLASIKHFAADGGTIWGTTPKYDWLFGNWQAPGDSYSIDQGVAQMDEAELRSVHLAPYAAAIEAGALNVMVSMSAWHDLKLTAHRYLLTDVLKGELGFKGFIVSDWMAINQLDRDYATCVVTAINAGLDMVMVPFDYRLFIDTLTSAVEQGDVTIARIDDAVRRILRAKYWLGLFEQPFGDDALLPEVGSPAHRAVGREAVRKSLVLLKNEGDVLPLPKDVPTLLVAGRGADNIGLQCGGWSIEWQGMYGKSTVGTSILEGLRQTVSPNTTIHYNSAGVFPEQSGAVGIVVVGEDPYAEGVGDRGNLALEPHDITVIERMRTQCDKLILVVMCGRPQIITDQLAQADAVVIAWLPGTEGAGVADVLLGDYGFSGKLPHHWPRSMTQVPLQALKESSEGALFPLGYGLTTAR